MFNFSKTTCSNHPITTLKENSTSHHSSINMLWHLTFFIVNSMGIICLINHEKIHVSHEKKFAVFVCRRIFLDNYTRENKHNHPIFLEHFVERESHVFYNICWVLYIEVVVWRQKTLCDIGDKHLVSSSEGPFFTLLSLK